MTGNFRIVSIKTKNIRFILWIILGCMFFLHKPEWCLLRPDMVSNCESNFSGINFHLLLPFFMSSSADSAISLIIMGIITTYQYFLFSNVKKFNIERQKFNFQFTFFLIALTIRVCIIYQFILPTNLENTMKILFILSSFTTIIRTIQRFIKLVKFTLVIIGVLFCTISIFSLYFRVRFKGKEMTIFDDDISFQVSFQTYTKTFFTMLGTVFLETFPILPGAIHKHCKFSYIIFWIYVILTAVILLSLI